MKKRYRVGGTEGRALCDGDVDICWFGDVYPKDGPALAKRIRDDLNELEEWRTGKRRVFWRVRLHHLKHSFNSARKAFQLANRFLGAKVYRVTVRPKVRP